jgi:two-component sensor histidine kinase
VPDVEGQGFFEQLDLAYASGQPFIGRDLRVVFRPTAAAAPEEHFVDFVYEPVRERDGSVSGIFVQGTDVTERARAAGQQRLLLDELSHRVKNNLATVQSIAAMTARGAGDVDAFLQAFQARLSALARAHDLLARNAWEAMDLHSLLADALDAFGERRVRLAGPRVRLDARQSLAAGLVVHELATNAAKYGALSQDGGRVEVGWAIPAGQRRLELACIELGGPPVRRPERRGFGTRLIERSVASDLRGKVTLDWQPEGLRCLISVPLASAASQDASPRPA